MKDEDEAADVLQDGFIKVFRNLHTFDQSRRLAPWIARIIVNTALEHIRKNKRANEIIEDYTNTVETSVDNIIEQLSAKEIIKSVEELPSKAALILKLYCIEGYSHKEIAENLHISIGTSKSQLNRARNLLKQSINKLHG